MTESRSLKINLDISTVRLFFKQYYSIRRCFGGRVKQATLNHLSLIQALPPPITKHLSKATSRRILPVDVRPFR